MAQARNMKQLNKLLMNELRKAMKEVEKTALADMQEAVDSFYAGGSPKMYERTGALGETPEVDNFEITYTDTGGMAKFNAKLDDSHQYTTGKKPSMKTVLALANDWVSPPPPHHLRETVGEPEFWQSAEREMEKSLNSIIVSHF